MCTNDAPGLDRRGFLRTSAMTLAAFALPWGARVAHAAPAGAGLPVLVAIYMRGAADGLNLVVPVRDRTRYEQLRPTIALKDKDLLTLNAQFSLNKALGALHPLYNRGELAVIHAVGSPHPTRSHFEAQDYMERAEPGGTGGSGWLNRSLVPLGGAADVLRAVGLGKRPLALSGAVDTFATPSLDAAAGPDPKRRAALAAMFAKTAGVYPKTGASAFAAADVIKTIGRTTTVTYPAGPFGSGLKDAAAIIKADVGARVICIDVGGWDHHNDLVDRMAGVGAGFAAALAAFWDDLGPTWRAKTCALTMTEFGRTAAENGSFGTDHGHGSVMFALGGAVNGGRVIADWPGLAPTQLNEGRDLKVTTDFRDVFAEVLNKHMKVNLADMGPIFPGRAAQAANFPGLF